MLLRLILLLTTVPLVELFLLYKLARWTSLPITILVVIGTGIAGGALARMQGLSVLNRIRGDLRSGGLPAGSLLDGALVLVAGALLLTPGLLTDGFGFFLLAPPGRALVRRLVRKWLRKKMQDGTMRVDFHAPHDRPPPGYPPVEGEDEDPVEVDAEVEVKDESEDED